MEVRLSSDHVMLVLAVADSKWRGRMEGVGAYLRSTLPLQHRIRKSFYMA